MFLSKHATGMPCGRGGGDYAGPHAAGFVRGGGDYAGPRAAGSVRGGEDYAGPRAVGSVRGWGFMDVMYGCYVM